MYADIEYYVCEYEGIKLNESNRAERLRYASDCVDILTYGRIRRIGFDELTKFQQNTILEFCCRLAEWQAENEELISGAVKNYSINGVSVQYDTSSGAVITQNGVVMPKMLYTMLVSTGLCYGGLSL